MKNFSLILTISLLSLIKTDTTYDAAIANLNTLESYIQEYQSSSGDTTSLDQLLLSYIREGKYTGLEWSIVAGSCPEALVSYITTKDQEKGTNVAALRSYGSIETPSGDKIDFVHLFAVMNGVEYGNSFTSEGAGLVGWAGDLAQLFQDISSFRGTVEELVAKAREYLGIKGQFGLEDLVSNLDAVVIWDNRRKNTGVSYGKIFDDYYSTGECVDRVKNFVKLSYPEIDEMDKNKFRQNVYKYYSGNSLIKILECTYGFRSSFLSCKLFPGDLLSDYVNHPTAVSYALADYLFENI